ncbi:hypothetical protein TNIN_338631 [Trichonephila inaurata madagascariensis]|uniref:Uncharacterized protein n=1 Tax=Trichonephila inaurata madagascariensis TaxID=2747483 RepID=A0A8X6YQS1_9ARAC|nr:hypothetical protein TNIN_338631 [Trichonephila inaurata madagascariensis]
MCQLALLETRIPNETTRVGAALDLTLPSSRQPLRQPYLLIVPRSKNYHNTLKALPYHSLPKLQKESFLPIPPFHPNALNTPFRTCENGEEMPLFDASISVTDGER